MRGKQRVSVSVDADLLAEAERAAARGAVASVSAWVNDAMRLKLVHDRRLWALAAFIADHEAQHGEITPADMESAARDVKRRSVATRGSRAAQSRRRSMSLP